MIGLMIAGEASGDLYGGKLAEQLKFRIPSLQLSGMGGERMRAAHVELLHHYADATVLGVFEVLGKVRALRKILADLKQWIDARHPEFAVLIDFPDFNFRIAR